MADIDKTRQYFRARNKVKDLMTEMLKFKDQWTESKKLEFEKAWRDYCKVYYEHKAIQTALRKIKGTKKRKKELE